MPPAESFELEVPDGARFRLEWRDAASGPAAPLVVLAPAMGVEASYYGRALDSLATEGVPSLSADLRGLGGSSLRAGWGTDFGYRETVEIDLPAIVAEARRRAPERPVAILGHSLGGQLACLFAALHPGTIDGLLLVASCSVHFRGWPGPIGWGLATFQGFAFVLSKLLGYFPGRALGFGGREARGVVADWVWQGFTGRYRLRDSDADPEAQLRQLEVPVQTIRYSDDRYNSAAAVEHLLGKMPRADVERIVRRPEEAGVESIGHFSWARKPEVLLPDALPWLRRLAERASLEPGPEGAP